MGDRDDAHGLPPPDWVRYATGVKPSRAFGVGNAPVGDSTRWGGTVSQQIISPGAGFSFFQSPQFIRAQAADPYSRVWSALGTVRCDPQGIWTRAAADWILTLEVVQGVGQSRVTQLYDLRLLTTIGLTVYAPNVEGAGGNFVETRSFAISGGLLGQAVDARLIQVVTAAAVILTPANITVTVVLAPLAAGHGI